MMSANQTDTSAILNFLTAIAALFAVGLAVASELRAQKRFKEGNEIQEKIAAANIKPLLGINQHLVIDLRKVILYNHGLGSAVITNIVFTKGGRSGYSIPSVLEHVTEVSWKSFKEYSHEGTYLRAGDHDDLLVLSGSWLKDQGLTDAQIIETFRKVDSELAGTKISIEFEDVLGNRQPNFEYTLD